MGQTGTKSRRYKILACCEIWTRHGSRYSRNVKFKMILFLFHSIWIFQRSNLPNGGGTKLRPRFLSFGGAVWNRSDWVNPYSDLHEFDITTKTWRILSVSGAGPTANTFVSAAILYNSLYTFGGGSSKSGELSKECMRFDLISGKWEKLDWISDDNSWPARDSSAISFFKDFRACLVGGKTKWKRRRRRKKKRMITTNEWKDV